MAQPKPRLAELASVAVAPRERQYSIVPSLLSLFATVPPDVRVVVAQGDIPEELRQSLEDLRKIRSFELIEPSFPLYPQEARNLAIESITTDYVAIVDNDMEYEPGWLDALVGNAIENDAAMVAPVIFIGPPRATNIHHAGGRIRIQRMPDGKLRADEKHIFSRENIADVDIESLGIENHTVEFHCFLASSAYLASIGGLDERLTTQEQIHYGLLARHLGAKVTFEGAAHVTYSAFTRFSEPDLEYMSFRWNDWAAGASMDAIESAWGIDFDRARLLDRWIRPHRTRAYGSFYTEQFAAMPIQKFYNEVAMQREIRALKRARDLRGQKRLAFTDVIDPARRAETVDSFTKKRPQPVPAS
jgi:hypothetical protein